MANRYVFKIVASVGPGGCIVNFCEKICRTLFFEAYEQGDPQEAPSLEFQAKARQQRENFVNELFEKRGGFERELNSLNEQHHQNAYQELSKIIMKHRALIVKSEMSRLARERLFFKPGSMRYKSLVEKSKRVDSDTMDNLMKMVLHINKLAKADRLMAAIQEVAGVNAADFDLEEGNIEERISHNRA